jgi:hypothetical protein
MNYAMDFFLKIEALRFITSFYKDFSGAPRLITWTPTNKNPTNSDIFLLDTMKRIHLIKNSGTLLHSQPALFYKPVFPF